MAKPPSEWEHLQSVLRKVHNKQVTDYFREDIPDDNINTPESALKHACRMKDTDTAAMASCRMMLFSFTINNGRHLHPEVWAVPDFTPDVYNELRPQVIIQFAEKLDDWKSRGSKRRKVVRCSYRLMGETSDTMTQSALKALARKIDAKFPRSYTFKTGRYKVTYSDKPKGYHLITAPYSPAIGDKLVKDLLELTSTEFESDKRSEGNRRGANYRAPRYVDFQGGRKELPERRQIATTYLDRVEVNLYGQQGNIRIIDRMITSPTFGSAAQYLD